jgi:branched-chain amino acid transport system permease protein
VSSHWGINLTLGMKYAARGRRATPWILFLAAIVVCSVQGPFLLSVATVTLLWVVLASGLNVIMGHGGLVNFGIGAFYGIGSYAAASLAVKDGMPIEVCLVAGAVIAAAAAAVIGPVILARTRGFQFAIATLAVGLVVDDIFTNWTPVTGGVLGIAGIQRPGFLQGTIQIYYFIAACAVVVVAVCDYIGRRRLGQVLRGLRDDQVLARSLAFRPLTYQLSGFVVSGAIAGLGGALYAYYIQYVSPGTYGLSGASFEAFAIVAFGGIGTTWGPVIGAVLLTAISQFVNVTPEVKLIFYGVALLIIVMAMPEGIVPGSMRLAARLVAGRLRRTPPALAGQAAATGSQAHRVRDDGTPRQPPERRVVER